MIIVLNERFITKIGENEIFFVILDVSNTVMIVIGVLVGLGFLVCMGVAFYRDKKYAPDISDIQRSLNGTIGGRAWRTLSKRWKRGPRDPSYISTRSDEHLTSAV